jgi:hypothetical protein
VSPADCRNEGELHRPLFELRLKRMRLVFENHQDAPAALVPEKLVHPTGRLCRTFCGLYHRIRAIFLVATIKGSCIDSVSRSAYG